MGTNRLDPARQEPKNGSRNVNHTASSEINGCNYLTDSTEWIATRAPFLMRFEDSLRCPICSDILKTPSLTDCAHTFCGICIRRHLDLEAKCPICRGEVQSSRLRPNKAMENTCEIYNSVRQSMLTLLAEPPVSDRGADDNASRPVSSSDTLTADESLDTEGAPINVNNGSNSRLKRTRRSYEELSSSPSGELVIPEGMAQCPICSLVMPLVEIEGSHIEMCLKKDQRDFKAKQPKELKKEAKPMYSMMSERKVKDLLAQAGLSCTGTKRQLISRHQEWVAQWNTNVESSNPESKSEVRSRVQAWEKSHNSPSIGTSSLKDMDAEQWTRNHEEGFANLALQARQSKNRKISSSEE